MRKFHAFLIILLLLGQSAGAEDYLIPLDDRPANRLFVEQVARIGAPQNRLILPPRHLLGKLYEPGNSEALIEWADERLQQGDTLFVAVDMWLYGGLVASRTASIDSATVERRLERLQEIGGRGVVVHALATLPRLSLRTSDQQAPHERTLANWAAKGDLPSVDNLLSGNTAVFPEGVPEDAVREYLQVRNRNISTVHRLITLCRLGYLDSLVLGQDDSHKTGLHRGEQAGLREQITAEEAGDKVTLLSGIDELTMCMISGVWARRAGHQPTVRVVYSDPSSASEVPPLESLPLAEMVSQHVTLAGARSVEGESADFDLYIYVPYSKPWNVPGEERRPPAEEFVKVVQGAMDSGREVAVADLSLVNRMDPFLAENALEDLRLFELEGFASWNTPANTVGTVVSQAVCHQIAEHSPRWSLSQRLESEKTHQAFLLARFIDDYAFQTVVRDEVRPGTGDLSSTADPLLNLFGPPGLEVRLKLVEWGDRLFREHYLGETFCLLPQEKIVQFTRADLEVVLPWPRLFEVEARLDLRLDVVGDCKR